MEVLVLAAAIVVHGWLTRPVGAPSPVPELLVREVRRRRRKSTNDEPAATLPIGL